MTRGLLKSMILLSSILWLVFYVFPNFTIIYLVFIQLLMAGRWKPQALELQVCKKETAFTYSFLAIRLQHLHQFASRIPLIRNHINDQRTAPKYGLMFEIQLLKIQSSISGLCLSCIVLHSASPSTFLGTLQPFFLVSFQLILARRWKLLAIQIQVCKKSALTLFVFSC